MIVVDRLINIRERLRLHALRRVDDENGTFAGSKTAADFVSEIHMPRRIHQIQLISFAVLRLVHQAHRLSLDRDAAFALDIHAVEHLLFHVARLDRTTVLDQAVGKRRFPMIDMGDDREITDMALVGHVSFKVKDRAVL